MSGTNGILERKALIFNVQKYNVYDGPGIFAWFFYVFYSYNYNIKLN